MHLTVTPRCCAPPTLEQTFHPPTRNLVGKTHANMRTSPSAVARGPRWRRTDPSCRTRDGGDDVDDGNDDSGGDGNDDV